MICLLSAEDDISPFAEFSIWKQGAADTPASLAEPESVEASEPEPAPPDLGRTLVC